MIKNYIIIVDSMKINILYLKIIMQINSINKTSVYLLYIHDVNVMIFDYYYFIIKVKLLFQKKSITK